MEELKERSHANIQSECGILKRQTRSIQTEGHFGDIKENENFRRFNYRSVDKVYKEFMLYAIGRNINKQVAEPESLVTVRIFLFGAVSFKKCYLPTVPSLCEIHNLLENVLKKQEKYLNYSVFADFGYFSSGFGKKCIFFSPIMQL